MNSFCKHISFVLLVFLQLHTVAQVEVGSWRDYLPYTDFKSIVDGGDYIYAATEYSILQIDKEEKSINRISKLTGLSDSRVTAIGYYSANEVLMVGYSDGKIDFVEANTIINIADIERSDIIADKRINKFSVVGDEVFISTGFGIVRYDLVRNEVRDTYIIGANGAYEEVLDVELFNDSLYAATPMGLKYASYTDPLLSFYETWEYNYSGRGVDQITSNQDRILARQINDLSVVDTVIERVGNNWEIVPLLSEKFIRNMDFNDNILLVSRDGAVIQYSSNWDTIRLETNYGEGRISEPNDAIVLNENDLWVADATFGVVSIPGAFQYEFFSPDGPRTINAERITYQKEKMLIATGGKTEGWGNTFLIDGVFQRGSTGYWSEYSLRFDTALNDVRDFIAIEVNPNVDNGFVVGTIGSGLLWFENEEYLKRYDSTNSTLNSRTTNESSVAVTDVVFDDEGNLWCANSLSTEAIHVMDPDGSWTGFEFAGTIEAEATGDLIIANDNSKWLTLPNKGEGILVFNENGSIDDVSDDQFTIINSTPGKGGLPSSNIYSIAKDREGEIWVGTDQGVGVFFSPSSVFGQGNYDAQRPLVSLGGFLQYLLESETVTAIAIDGANRKWFGTSNSGVFLMSEDGTEELLHFTSENSALLSNTIKTIAINPNDGEVVISTDRGMIAYRGTATEPDPTFNNVKVFPNPVYEDYAGLIAIEGLAVNSRVRITDVNGQLVFETYSEGGQATWNGKRMDGAEVTAGVYLVFALDEEGVESEVSKILMIK